MDTQPLTPDLTAMYLRCYPYDLWQMDTHQWALRSYALRLGLGDPPVFLDNGCRSHDPLSALPRLLQLIEDGHCQTVLVPGPFVFSLNAARADATIQRITESGCRVLELPPTRPAPPEQLPHHVIQTQQAPATETPPAGTREVTLSPVNCRPTAPLRGPNSTHLNTARLPRDASLMGTPRLGLLPRT